MGGIFRLYIYFVPNFYVVVFQNLLVSIDGDFIVGDGDDVTRCCFGQIVCPLVSQLYFGKELYMFRTDLLFIIRSLKTVFTAIGIFHTSYVDYLLARSRCPKHVAFFTKIKLRNIASRWLLL